MTVPPALMMVSEVLESLYDGTTSGKATDCQPVNCLEYDGPKGYGGGDSSGFGEGI
jgi:hypothetical protein